MEDIDDDSLEHEKNIGYFSTLNLNYCATDEEIKKYYFFHLDSMLSISHLNLRNFNELYERYNNKYEKEFLEKKEIIGSAKKGNINPKELMEKIYISYSILEDRFVFFFIKNYESI